MSGNISNVREHYNATNLTNRIKFALATSRTEKSDTDRRSTRSNRPIPYRRLGVRERNSNTAEQRPPVVFAGRPYVFVCPSNNPLCSQAVCKTAVVLLPFEAPSAGVLVEYRA